MKILVCGLGYVGTAVAACLVKDGHTVVGVDADPAKNRVFGSGRTPVREPGVEELLQAGLAAGKLFGSVSLADHADDAEVILVCVGTPVGGDGTVDLSQVLAVTDEIGAAVGARPSGAGMVTIAYRSTMLPGSMEETVVPALARQAGPSGGSYEAVYNPEFLREGTAIQDYFEPPRIVIGERTPGSEGRLSEIYQGIDAPLFRVPFAMAEMVKYADNSFHALKVAFANELGRLAEALAISPKSIAELFLADTKLNISPAYLRPGGAFGGSCLPKDMRALTACLKKNGVGAPVMEAVLPSNTVHKEHLVEHVLARLPRGGHVLLLGLTFKPGTDDLRESPLVDLAESLLNEGFRLTIHDPDLRVARLTGDNFDLAHNHLNHLFMLLTDDVEEVVETADLVIIGKRMPGLASRLVVGGRCLDLDRL